VGVGVFAGVKTLWGCGAQKTTRWSKKKNNQKQINGLSANSYGPVVGAVFFGLLALTVFLSLVEVFDPVTALSANWMCENVSSALMRRRKPHVCFW
jgi:hypothetical protein